MSAPKRKRLLIGLKGFIGAVATVSIIQESPYWACGFFIAGAALDELIKYLYPAQ